MLTEQPPYLRVVADIERRITSRELRPGDRVPSTRQLMRQWAIAMATATKALPARTMLHTTVTVNGYVAGIALSQAFEIEIEQDTGLSGRHRGEADKAILDELFESGRFPKLSSVGAETGELGDLDELFEFGLQRQLDGIAALLANQSAG